MLALALQGIGGLNSFAAGVLHEFRKNKIQPDLISATSGSVISTYHFLNPDHGSVQYNQLFKTGFGPCVDRYFFIMSLFWGMPGVFRPIYPLERILSHPSWLSLNDWFNFLFPSRLYKSLIPHKFFEDMAECFITSNTGIIINAYDFMQDKAVVYVNQAALDKTELKLKEYDNLIIKNITPDGVISSLQLLYFGSNHGEYDGGYQFNPILYPLTVADRIILVTLQPFGTPLKPEIENYFDLEDFKIKMLFKNALYAQLNEMELINKLVREGKLQDPKYKEIKIHIIQPTLDRGYFDYFIETDEFFNNGITQANKFLEQVRL